MTREEITNSQDYKATKVALEWWYSLPDEQRKATDIDAEPDIVDAYSEGVIYGWSHPHWIPVEERLPPKTTDWANPKYFLGSTEEGGIHKMYRMGDPTICKDFENEQLYLHVTHWMPIVPPRKE